MLITSMSLFIGCSNKQAQEDSNFSKESKITSEESINEDHLEESDSLKDIT